MFVHVPAPRRPTPGTAPTPTPEPASAELDVTATALPRTFVAATGAVIAPSARSLSTLNVTALVAVFPAASATVTVYVPGVDAPLGPRERHSTVYGAPAGVDTISAACVVQPAVGSTGNGAEARPDPPSVTVDDQGEAPAAFDLK